MNGTVVGIFLYYDASVKYFGKEHLPYAVLAVFVVLIFILFPILLLLLYPMRCFQRCLGCCGVRWHALHIFIDASYSVLLLSFCVVCHCTAATVQLSVH